MPTISRLHFRVENDNIHGVFYINQSKIQSIYFYCSDPAKNKVLVGNITAINSTEVETIRLKLEKHICSNDLLLQIFTQRFT